MSRPWWEGKSFAAIGNSMGGGFDTDWAIQALAEQALQHGGFVSEQGLEGQARGTFEELSAKIEELGFRIAMDIPAWRGDKTARRFLVAADGMVTLFGGPVAGDDVGARVVSSNALTFRALKDVLEDSIGPKGSNGKIYVLTTSGDEGIKLKSLGTAAMPLERGNYNPEVLGDFDAVVSDLKSQDPSGRLSIFDGPPGTGKTHLMKGLLAACPEALFVLVPVGLVPQLGDPSFIGSLIEMRRDKDDRQATVLVIEDADKCLGSRQDANVEEVSALLNLSDGIIGALLDLRMVCSTNLRDEELDDAVTRPGRLSRKITMGFLHADVAATLYKKLTGLDLQGFVGQYTLAQIYTMARDSGWKPVVKKKSIGFGSWP